jgi:hypothetical protein
MSEPDEALLWAREHWATICDEDGFPDEAEAYRRGVQDESLAADALFYRAGQAASAKRIKALEGALKDSVTAMRLLLDAVQKHNEESDTFLSGFPLHLLTIEIAQADALLKEADQ